MIPAAIRPQVDVLVAGLEKILGTDLVGVYLHGSAVLGCFGPWSDIDTFAVSRRALTADERLGVLELALAASGPYEGEGPLRPMELDVVTAAALDRWRHPAPFEFHYSESLRARFEAGEVEPWESKENRDLAAHVAMLRASGIALGGPSPQHVFPDIPEPDFRDALLYDVDWQREHLAELEGIPGGIRNAVLGLARVWATLASDELHSKASGADWARPQIPARLRPVLDHASNIYRGDERRARWKALPVADYVDYVGPRIDAIR